MTTTRKLAAWELIDAAQTAGIPTYDKTTDQLAYRLEHIAGQMYVKGSDDKGIQRCEWVGDEGYGRKLVEYRNNRLAEMAR